MELTWLLLFLLVAASVAQGGLDKCDMWNRLSWLNFCALVAVAFLIKNPWAALCVAMVAVGMLTVIPRTDVWTRAGWPALTSAAAYAAFTPHISRASVEPVLWTFLALGCWIGLWTDYSRQQGYIGYQHWWPYAPFKTMQWPPLCWHEDARTHLKAGQGNSNHLQCVSVLCTAAMLGLVLLGHWVALLAWPLVIQPLIRRVTRGTRWGQGHLHLATLLVTSLGVWSGKVSWLVTLLLLYLCFLLAVGKPWTPRQWWLDGNRLWLWMIALKAWRKISWRQRWFGMGTGTWQPFSTPLTVYQPGHVIYTTAHNEYVQWLIEHGLIGLFLLTGYLLTGLGRLWHGGMEGQAVFLLAMSLCSIAMTNFPWSYFHEIARPMECQGCKKILVTPSLPRPPHECQCPQPVPMQHQPYYVGSPTLIAMSLVIAILAEAF